MSHPLAGEIGQALELLLGNPPNPILKLRWDEDRGLWASRIWVGLPLELQEVFDHTGYGCFALPYTCAARTREGTGTWRKCPRHRGASEREDLVTFVTHAPDEDIESFRGAPVLYRWELIELPTAPIVRFRAMIVDDPAAPYMQEHFLNVEDPDQARCLARLVEQEQLTFDFFGADYEYAYSKYLPHPEGMRVCLTEIAARALAQLAHIRRTSRKG